MTSPGGTPPARCCDPILNRDTPLGIDASTRKDLFILLPVDASQPISDMRIQITGEDHGLQVTTDPSVLARAAEHFETRTYPKNLGPPASDGHRIDTGWVARVPSTSEKASELWNQVLNVLHTRGEDVDD